jgi:hypothetical protein
MPGKAKSKKVGKDAPVGLRGAIDQIEGDIVVVALDDGQRLDWPRRFAPEEARSGDAVIVKVIPADDAHWSGAGEAAGEIALGRQTLRWPGRIAAGPVGLSIAIDAADTAARKERVRGLVDDIFKT